MAKLGTLWFGADIDLTQLKQKIEQGNKDVLNALKIKFDAQSYDNMTQQLRTKLKNEKFEVGIVINQAKVSKAVQAALANAGLSNNATPGMVRSARISAYQTKEADQHAIAMARLARMHNTASRAANAHGEALVHLNAKLGHGITLSNQLGSVMAGIWGVVQLKQFATELITIGGEFQKQRIALESMLGSLAKADAMYARMKELAVESPFTFSDLMSYTKQLSAFQIPYEELYDTTKRLSDISAGLGVDMSRIILAYGQVRSAAFLRGQEVRQFTEAGIPLLDALAKKFTELEGKVVSTGDVFEKISKRQVSFQMVKDVLWELTDEGGKFYNMQAKLTDSLSGKLAKLRDTYEITLGEMAQGNNAALGGLLDTLTLLATRLDTIIGLVGTAGAAWYAYRGAVLLASITINKITFLRLAAQLKQYTIALYQAAIGVKALDKATKATTWGVIAAAITALVVGIWSISNSSKSAADKIRELSAAFEEENNRMAENDQHAKRLVKNMFDESKAIEEKKAAYVRLQEIYPDMFKNMSYEEAHHRGMVEILKEEAKAAKDLAESNAKTYLASVRQQKEQARIALQNNSREAIADRLWYHSPRYVFSGEEKRKEMVEKEYNEYLKAYSDAIEAENKAEALLDDIRGQKANADKNRKEKWFNDAKRIAEANNLKDLIPDIYEDYKTYFDKVEKARNDQKGFLAKLQTDSPAYNQTLKDVNALDKLWDAIGGKDKTTGGGGSSKDPQLEALKNRVSLYKKFFAQLKEARKLYGDKGALDYLKVQGFADVFKWGLSDVENFGTSLDELAKGFQANTAERKNFINSLDADKVGQRLKEDEEEIADYVSKLDKMLEAMKKGYETYKKWIDLTGNEQLASSMANIPMGLSYAQWIEDELGKALKRLGGQYSVAEILGMSETKVPEAYGILSLYKAWHENNKQLQEDNEKLFEEAIKGAKRYEDKVADVNRKLEEQINAINAQKGLSEDEKERLIANETVNANKELSKLSFQNFKDTNDWGRIFGDLNSISLPTIKRMVQAMRDYGDATNFSVEDTRAWYQALQKLLDREAILDPMGALADYAKQFSDNSIEKGIALGNLDALKRTIEELEMIYQDDPTADNAKAIADERKKYNNELNRYNSLVDKEREIVNQMTKAIRELGSSVSQLGSDISQLGSDIGGKTGDILSGFGGMLGSLGKGISALGNEKASLSGFQGVMGKASVVTGVASAMIQMNKSLSKLLPSVDKLYEKHAKEIAELSKLQSTIASINLSQAQRESQSKRQGANGLAGLLYDYEVTGKAIEQYRDLAASAQAVYKNKKAGWKKVIGPVVGAIVGVVAGIFTFGAGSALGAAVGTALGTALGGVMGATTAAITATIVASGIGGLIGSAITAGIESAVYKEGETAAINNLRIETRKKKFFKDQKTQDLVSWVKDNLGMDLFHGEEDGILAGLLNVDVAEKVLEKYGDKLVGETKDTLQELLELSKQAQEYLDNVSQYVGDRFSPIVDNMTEALWDWVSTGEDAMDKFYDYASDTFRNVAKDAVNSFLRIAVFDKLKKELDGLFTLYGIGGLGEGEIGSANLMAGVAALAGDAAQKLNSVLPIAEQLTSLIVSAFDAVGYDIRNKGNSSNSVSGNIKGITENTADLLAAYLNAIRADVAVDRTNISIYFPMFAEILSRSNVIAETQVTLQQQIANNTLRNAEAAETLRDAIYRMENGATSIKVRY